VDLQHIIQVAVVAAEIQQLVLAGQVVAVQVGRVILDLLELRAQIILAAVVAELADLKPRIRRVRGGRVLQLFDIPTHLHWQL
jgi:hypothetical protein